MVLGEGFQELYFIRVQLGRQGAGDGQLQRVLGGDRGGVLLDHPEQNHGHDLIERFLKQDAGLHCGETALDAVALDRDLGRQVIQFVAVAIDPGDEKSEADQPPDAAVTGQAAVVAQPFSEIAEPAAHHAEIDQRFRDHHARRDIFLREGSAEEILGTPAGAGAVPGVGDVAGGILTDLGDGLAGPVGGDRMVARFAGLDPGRQVEDHCQVGGAVDELGVEIGWGKIRAGVSIGMGGILVKHIRDLTDRHMDGTALAGVDGQAHLDGKARAAALVIRLGNGHLEFGYMISRHKGLDIAHIEMAVGHAHVDIIDGVPGRCIRKGHHVIERLRAVEVPVDLDDFLIEAEGIIRLGGGAHGCSENQSEQQEQSDQAKFHSVSLQEKGR